MTPGEALEWLYATQLHGIKLGLGNIRRLLEALAVPVAGDTAPGFLHVAGTNGKGSVCAMLEAICRTGGRRVGLFTSPHLISFHERIRVDGRMISEAETAAGLSAIRELVTGWDHSPTFFEITTALALAHFQRTGTELVVLETGMGGRFDATNVVTPRVSILTAIDLDHQQWLGATVGEIAREKAGIIKPGVPVVSAPQVDEVRAIIHESAQAQRSGPVHFVDAPWMGATNLIGSHQRWNAALAVAALDLAALPFSPGHLARGLQTVEWRGRFHRVSERVVLDGAHNPAAAHSLAETWREVFGAEKATLVLGMLEDKDMRGICAALLPLAAQIIAVPVRNPRSASAEQVAAIVRELDPALSVTAQPDLSAALSAISQQPDRVLIAGSLFLVGEALAYFEQLPCPEPSAQ